jgi:hypothetical protein
MVSSFVLILLLTQVYLNCSLDNSLVTVQEYLATFGYSNMCITVFYLIWTEKKSLYLSVLYVDLRFFLEL